MSLSRRIEGVLYLREWPNGTGQATFWCPGCNAGHTVELNGPEIWQWNGDASSPTFTPSVLASPHQKLNAAGRELVDAGRSTELTDEHRVMTPRCHSFVTDGKIQFLSDSEHELANQTVPLGPLPERYRKFLRD